MKELTFTLVVLVLGVIIGIHFRSCTEWWSKSPTIGKTVTVVKRDTLYAIVPETSYVYRKGATVHVTDTVEIVSNHPFVATVDTVMDKVAIRDSFFYPQMVFSTNVRRLADSIQYIERTHLRVDTIGKDNSSSTWQTTLETIGSLIVGIFVGRATK